MVLKTSLEAMENKGRATLTPPSLLLDNHHDGITARAPPFILKYKGSTLKGKGLLSYRPERGCQTGFETLNALLKYNSIS